MNNLDTNTEAVTPRTAHAKATRGKRSTRPSAAKPRKLRLVASFGPEIEEPITVVEAHGQVGPNDTLYIRGQGSGLRWDVGQPMTWVEPAKWVWCTQGGEPGTEFKVLVNDEVWAAGENSVLRPGEMVTIHPQFEICVPA